jgi:hypothetical protein
LRSPARKAKDSGGSWLWPLVLVVVGIVLLLDNFLLLGDFNAVTLLPLVLVIAGAQILLRGDLAPGIEGRTFGITRGSVESATLEVSSGDVDVEVRALQREGRLIAGQYAARSRPSLRVRDHYAHLKMDRAGTPWLSLADWQAGLARDLPWQILISAWLGQVNLDLSEVIVHEVVVATGFGDIRFVCPPESLEPVHIRSALGNIHVVTPPGYRSQIIVGGSRMFKVHHDIHRYENPEPNVYRAAEAAEDAPLVKIYLSGTFGDVYLT